MEESELQIIKKCQDGNLGEFSYLYDRYINKIYQFVYYRVMHKETAEDLTSKTFIKALEKIKSYDPAKGSFSSWLYQIARNTVIDYFRTRKDAVDISGIWDLAEKGDIETDLTVKQQLEKVMKYLDRLNPQQREIVIMRLWDGLSHQEIATVLGLSVASCKMAFWRVMGKLREDLGIVLFYFLLIIFKSILWIMN